MAVIKYWNGTKWIILNAKNLNKTDSIYFRIQDNKIEYSTDNKNWKKF